ncbi:ferritin [Paenibacillus mesotrionivorans]|jgi:ferritin|uniref:Ferritin n=1 Tax=Paenibacillus mesotrionivorans TaxID=3160968 RepID=A0ACC7NY33_9BACL
MVSDNLLKELNEQLNFEFYSAHVYVAMAAYCSSENLDGFANFFLVQAEEERFHAMKIYNYINAVGARATISGMGDVFNGYESVLDCYKKGLKHEKENTRRFYKLMDIAMEEREHATIGFLKWFIDEQVEEEDTFEKLIQKLKRIDKDSSAFYALEQELATRVFTPPANA